MQEKLRRDKDFKLLLNKLGSSVFADPNYALAMKFTTPEYWRAGVQQANLAAMSGYSFTRSGEQGAVDASGAVTYFAANTPALNNRGYHAYGALTNNLPRAQEFDDATWTKNDLTITANTSVAPDGTTTVDTLTATGPLPQLFQSIAVTAASPYTSSIFVPSGGTAAFAYIQVNTGANVCFVTLNRTTGAVSAETVVAGASATMVGYATAIGSGWRFSVTWIANTTAGAFIVFGLSDASASRAGTIGITAPFWQAQLLSGNYKDGGPIIRTAGAAASIGDNLLQVGTTAPVTSADQVWYAAVNLSATGNSQNLFEGVAAGAQRFVIRRQGAGDLYSFDALFAYNAFTGSGIYTSGRLVIAFCLQGGLWSLRMWFGGTHQNTAGAAGTWPAGNVVTIGIGQGSIGGTLDLLNGAVQFLGYKVGTFTTTEIDATLETL